jgi:N-acyl-D-aspartate/D-glutamate deacylase
VDRLTPRADSHHPADFQTYGLVIAGRVMDPESGLNTIRNVGITGDRIVRISVEPLGSRRVIVAKGLVVAPDFIEVHQRAQDNDSGRIKAFDGVTTALEMYNGVPDVASFLQRKRDHSLINYGTTASHAAARSLAFGTPVGEPFLVAPSGQATDAPATPEEIDKMEKRLNSELNAGAIDLQAVSDRSTYQSPCEPSVGMRYVIVNGTVLVDQGKLTSDKIPGQPIELDVSKGRSISHY